MGDLLKGTRIRKGVTYRCIDCEERVDLLFVADKLSKLGRDIGSSSSPHSSDKNIFGGDNDILGRLNDMFGS